MVLLREKKKSGVNAYQQKRLLIPEHMELPTHMQ